MMMDKLKEINGIVKGQAMWLGLVLIAELFLSIPLKAQTSMADLFRQMPDSLMPILTHNNRLDMIDFLEARMKARVDNLLGGESEMTILTSDSLSIRVSEAQRVDIFLVPSREEYDSCRQVICFLSSYRLASTGQEEQVVVCYSVRWRRLIEPELVSPLVPTAFTLRQDEDINDWIRQEK
jgi:hypothetical protein